MEHVAVMQITQLLSVSQELTVNKCDSTTSTVVVSSLKSYAIFEVTTSHSN